PTAATCVSGAAGNTDNRNACNKVMSDFSVSVLLRWSESDRFGSSASPPAPATAIVPAYKKYGARSDHPVTTPPRPGPAMPPSRKPPLNVPIARPRCPDEVTDNNNELADTVNIADPAPPTERSPSSCP